MCCERVKLHVAYSDEKTMISIGDVCPLFFEPLKYEYANKGSFRQCFDVSDGILLQVFCDGGETPSVSLNDKIHLDSSDVSLSTYEVKEGLVMHYADIRPSEGIYTVTVEGKESEEFEVCESSKGILIEYGHKDNNSVFDAIFWRGDDPFTFKLRVPGGFKPSGVSLEVDNEQFANQKQEIVELYSIPYKTLTFSIGDADGVPYYMAELVNKILCLSDVRIGGESFVREGNSKPEKVETLGKKELFMWSVTLRPSENPIAGMGGKTEEGVSANQVGFSISNPADGEVLVYDSSESAFVNTNQLSSI